MKAFKCDICGELFEASKPLKMPDGRQASIGREENLLFKACFFDICPNCINAIQETIDKRRQQNERSNV